MSNLLRNMQRPITVLVEGNIGAGKSLFLNRFRDQPGFKVMEEPVHKWRNLNGLNLLQLMYEDPVRWSLTFQTYVQLTMLEHHLETSADYPVKILERSIYSARYCFVENLKKEGKMQPAEYEVLDAWFQYLTSGSNWNLGADLIVYLKTSPEIAYERLKQRNRGEEKLISLQYIKDLQDLHEDWLCHAKFPIPGQVLTIEADKDASLMQPEFEHIKMRINQMLSKEDNSLKEDSLHNLQFK